ncbi:hypothetical protein FH972_026571 [Carpinus fangiana]|uniref:Uncharacterized protein n=1 Tax=Carpinus fangiana TaxID=176857 RepID=A0A5N6L4D0_9ROSI|nr:hypothetical protein FH972_026571 [Carpinus fangiana]
MRVAGVIWLWRAVGGVNTTGLDDLTTNFDHIYSCTFLDHGIGLYALKLSRCSSSYIKVPLKRAQAQHNALAPVRDLSIQDWTSVDHAGRLPARSLGKTYRSIIPS